MVHNVLADDGTFRSAYLSQGGSYAIKTSTPGKINIRCTVHSRMRGEIVVDPE